MAYQIRSNISWDLVVDNWESEQSYTLEDNQILTFSGTHQIHWRPKREFKDDEFLEAVFLHFAPLDAKDFSQEHLNKLKEKQRVLFDKWDKTEGLSSNPLVLEQ